MTRIWSSYQTAIFDAVSNTKSNLAINAVAGSGKCLGKDTPVLMYDGSIKPVQDIVTGDRLMGPDSKPRIVQSTTTGIDDLFEIIPVKGDKWVCNSVHVLTLTGTNRFNGQTIDIPLNEYLTKCQTNSSFSRDWKQFRVGVDFPDQEPLQVDPYFAGLWLGDGTTESLQFTTPDVEIIEYLREYATQHSVNFRMRDENNRGLKSIQITINTRERFTGKFIQPYARFPLRATILSKFRNSQGEKTIPSNYLTASRQDRLLLLAGLLDTDGYYLGNYEFSTKHRHMADQVLFLCRSLGFAAYMSEKQVQLESMIEPGTYYRISISGELSLIPCKVTRKIAPPRNQIKRVTVTGFSVNPIGKGEYYGFTLDGDGRFLLGDFTVTHNTTVLVEVFNRLPRNKKALFLAFNKHIVNELQSRLPGCDCKTIHSLGFMAIKSAKGKTNVKEHKIKDLVDEYFSRNEPTWLPTKFYGPFFGLVRQVVDKARLTLTDLNNEAATDDMLGHFGLWGELAAISDEGDINLELLGRELIKSAGRILSNSDRQYDRYGIIDFTDMLYIPCKYGLAVVGYDIVLVDEAQDLNAAQLELVMKATGKYGRVICVGDKRQAIQGFAGADSESFAKIISRTKAVELPLSICYRCPKNHIDLAQKIVPQIEPSPTAIDGHVETINMAQFAVMPRSKDLIICRVNAPLVGAALKLIANGIQARIRGRNIAAGLTKMIDEALKLGQPNPDEFEAGMTQLLQVYVDRRLLVLQSKPNTEVQQEMVNDQMECITTFMSGRPDIKDADQLCRELENLFADEGAAVWLSSIHRAKGLEADRVFVLRADRMRIERKSMLPWQLEQEANLEYVGLTRGKQALYLVKDTKQESPSTQQEAPQQAEVSK